ncbi:hypothetical protein A9P82_13490 [Arachidicoccus ginsenosidimutans]|uniref:ArnT family glycosyltransferase n=1 Tax=Arachidicoccus sp. BS20 TaxID=1850526 RepID=UPI0007F13878|nr:glycosyltransferase family 39 protein [Arachidicoccus sp. BS20]ANI90212.1 hypothetical protein A9P82_13490 [Arachidicoccus sp. BS20]
MQNFLSKNFKTLLAIAIVLNATALFTGVFTGDSALYADVAKSMAQKNDWLNLFAYGHDWLDKPHFPFWMTALSFKVFGINAFAYKLPAFIFWLIGLYYSFRLATNIYGKAIAQATVLIDAIALHGVIANFDVRAEAYLAALIIAAIYFIYRLLDSNSWEYYLGAALFAGCAVMTKGLFVLITILAGFILYWIIEKDWKQFIRPKWYLLLLLVLIAITPEMYALYTQFDLHSEKIVFGRTHVSGIKFFFWDSQFGRFFNTGPIKGKGDISFFLHTTLWAFLPWSIVLVFSLFKKSSSGNKRWIIIGSALVTFIVFSLSKFQLPHYIIILFPQFSMICAVYLLELKKEKTIKILSIVQQVIFYIAVVLIALLAYLIDIKTWLNILLVTVFLVIVFFVLRKKNKNCNIFYYSYAFAGILYLFMNLLFYPFLLTYQSGEKAAKDVDSMQNTTIGMVHYYSNDFRFSSKKPVAYLETFDSAETFLHRPSTVAFIRQPELDSLKMRNDNVKILKTYNDFHVTQLTLKFLNAKTRAQVLKKTYLISLQ